MSITDESYTQIEDIDSDEEDATQPLPKGSVAAVVSGTDWTTETIVSQLKRGNIDLNPRFQRRDAWNPDRKSRLIESLIVGLPVPQIVLAESKESRGSSLSSMVSNGFLLYCNFGDSVKEPTMPFRSPA